MEEAEAEEDDSAGEDDCSDVVEDVDGATWADVGALCFCSITADVGGPSWDGVVDIECVTVADG